VAKDGQQRKNEARERARIRREQERRRARQRQIFTYTGVIIGVLGVIAAIVIAGVVNHHSDKNVRAAASPAIVSAVTGVQPANLDAVGPGTVTAGLQPISGKDPLVADGKPELLYVGAEFCPHCAAERWSLAIALSRFGTFSGLETTRSATNDGNIGTLTFLHTTYTSQYLTFTPVENEDRAGKVLQKLTDSQSALVASLLPGGLSFPFVDFGNLYMLNGSQFADSILNGMSAEDIATQMSNPSTQIGQAIMGSANVMSAAICKMTKNQPSSVCSSSAVKAAATKLAAGGNGTTSGS
jgi:hypothetical protein